MRNQQEMMSLIVETAAADERIRAVYMNGSRTNGNAPKDIFQDYDIVYVVTETESFLKDRDWTGRFGELLIMQEPDQNDWFPGSVIDVSRRYAYLMLFRDGNRIDLTLLSRDAVSDEYLADKLTVPLLDKDGILPPAEAPTDMDYWVKKPSEARYLGSCNEFWWCLQNVGKGLWRDELPYAKHMFEHYVRNELDTMISWWIGTRHDFGISSGKMGKYFKRLLPPEYWEMYEQTYSDGKPGHFWDAVFTACELFRILAAEVAAKLSYTYPDHEDRNMTAYLQQVRALPADAEDIW
ncbi:aminoglycoside 6-adenylyltransferase [Paenibacillus typhae]|uniref:aminoglycoside 6-adenylyltransferase n=1 Tax=Paenibacillus typhae TaxID=1174501 RepID=UPI001C8D32A8|nr:aminoglycoside 6-adenylyltransferase [Paenibacillus typhae]MBY0012949.1 aminoglycoside 6-adenylyltransferase [Paenibacillus typhae]